MRLVATAAATLAIATSPAVADGVYVSESVGPGVVHDQLGAAITTTTFRAKIGIGVRFGGWALEPFYAAENTDPGAPSGLAPTLSEYGIDLKRVMPIGRHLAVYVRGSLSHLAYPDQAPCCFAEPLLLPNNYYDLYGWSGRGLGVGAGAQLSGRIPVLGLRGAVYVEDSYDYYRLLAPPAPIDRIGPSQMDGTFTRFALGFAIGADF